jgi:hypothetical protein
MNLNFSRRFGLWLLCLLMAPLAAGCETRAQTGALAGAGVGALMGQAIGRNTTGTVIGTAVGAGAGYVIGNQMDRREANAEQQRRDQAHAQALAQATAEAKPPPAPDPGNRSQGTFVPPEWPHSTQQMQPFADTTWRVTSMTPPPSDPFDSMTVQFQPNGLVVTTTVYPNGRVTADSESFRVVGNTLIINDIGYLTNSTWTIEGNRLTLINQNFRTVLERVGDGD